MATKQPVKSEPDPVRQDRQKLNLVIGKHVILKLGQPDDLLRVQVRPLWEAFYRVNILVGPDVSSAKIAQSYFLTADGEGNILTATPEIIKRY